MAGYWARHRLFLTIIMSATVSLVTSFLFVYPSIHRQASDYNAQSIYKNSQIDFIAPEPDFEQVSDLPGTNGIDKLFPFFMTKSQVYIGGVSRTTTLLLSDQFQNIDMTMYSQARLIEKAGAEYDNPILVDWQFCKDTGAKIGDTVELSIGGQNVDYKIFAVYETNTIYDGGAIIAEISFDQKAAIAEQSSNNGYSGMYISASDYNVCQSYLTTEYRPLGRLKDRDQFRDDEQYQVHYDAIMSSGYANEITDFRVRENGLRLSSSSIMVWIGAILAIIVILGFNLTMSKRGCEKVYFTKQRIPKGQDVKSYYSTAFIFELIIIILLYTVFLLIRLKLANEYIPGSAVGLKVVVIPVAVVVAEIIALIMNYSAVSEMTRKVELEMQKAKEVNEREAARYSGQDEREDVLQNQNEESEH